MFARPCLNAAQRCLITVLSSQEGKGTREYSCGGWRFRSCASVVAIVFAVYLARWVLANDTGTPEMRKVSDAIFTGAQAFLRRQYRTIAMLAVVAAVVIGVLLGFLRHSNGGTSPA